MKDNFTAESELLAQCQIAPASDELRTAVLSAASQAMAEPDADLKERVLSAANDAWATDAEPIQTLNWKAPLLTLAASIAIASVIITSANSHSARSVAELRPAAASSLTAELAEQWRHTNPGYLHILATQSTRLAPETLTARRIQLKHLLNGDQS